MGKSYGKKQIERAYEIINMALFDEPVDLKNEKEKAYFEEIKKDAAEYQKEYGRLPAYDLTWGMDDIDVDGTDLGFVVDGTKEDDENEE